jgi:hypothetical protein
MPTNTPVDNMARLRANAKCKSTEKTKKPPGKAPRTAPVPSADLTVPPGPNLKEPPPTATTTATAEAAVAAVATSRTTNTTASVSTRMPPSTVHVLVSGGGGDYDTANNKLTKATSATTLAFDNLDSEAVTNAQMTFMIRNYVTKHFF